MLGLRSFDFPFFPRQIGACPRNGMVLRDFYWPRGQACRGSRGPSPNAYKLRLLLIGAVYGSVALANRDVLTSPTFCRGILAKFYFQIYQN